jgi:hypothetical protein
LPLAAALAVGCFGSETLSPAPDASAEDAEVLDATPDDVTVAADVATASETSTMGMDALGAEASEASTSDLDVSAAEASASPSDASTTSPDANASPDSETSAFGSLGALSFDGINAWVHLPVEVGGASNTSFSVELWFRARETTGNMFEVYDSGGGADRFLSLNAGQVCFYVYASPPTQVCSSVTTYRDASWHHAAGTLGAHGMNLYVDGVLAASSATPTASTFTTDTDFRLGMGHTAFDSPIVQFKGDLDEVRVWRVERSAADIAANFQRTIDPATSDLQGYWKLDETGAATTAHDETSGAHEGQLTSFDFTTSPWFRPGSF